MDQRKPKIRSMRSRPTKNNSGLTIRGGDKKVIHTERKYIVPDIKAEPPKEKLPEIPTPPPGALFGMLGLEKMPNDTILQGLENALEQYRRAAPLATAKLPFLVRIENGTNQSRPYGAVIGKFFSPRGTWFYRIIRLGQIGPNMVGKTGVHTIELDATNISPVPWDEAPAGAKELLDAIKAIDMKINAIPQDGEVVK
ncbi:hypothetical protein CZP2022_281 [Vibrio phage C-ZP2022]|nr:hypothetical protein CZP2022_281 [Vibrio phage C-ZP2022]